MIGWIKVNRKIQNRGWYRRPEYLALWVHINLKANHEETEFLFNGEIVMIQAGQFITGRITLSEETGISASTIERILKFFENEQLIEQQTSNRNRMISILSWDEDQKGEQQNEQPVDNKRTASGQPVDTNKNEKNIKNDKNVKNKALFFSLTENFSDEEKKLLRATFDNFIEMRMKKRKPLTEKAVELLFTDLTTICQVDVAMMVAVMNKSIKNSWSGVFPLKETKDDKNSYEETFKQLINK